MNWLGRSAFVLFCILISCLFCLNQDNVSQIILKGSIMGISSSILILTFELFSNRYNLKKINTFFLGIFIGYLFGVILSQVFQFFIQLTAIEPSNTLSLIQGFLFLCGLYLGFSATLKKAEDLYVSIPFLHLKNKNQLKKDLLIDSSVLDDPRIIDLANSGLVDQHLLIPRFVLNDLQGQLNSTNEPQRMKAKSALEVFKKLEQLPDLNLRIIEKGKESNSQNKMINLAKDYGANIITSDMNKVESSTIKGTRIININNLSSALKPLMQGGENIQIKIQRFGKEPRQGIGYLDDGTMIVVNGGGYHIGKTIPAVVLSVKHTSSGRMIFCNVDEKLKEQEHESL